MSLKHWILCSLTFLLAFERPISRSEAAGPGDDFDAKVAPILARRCLDCHSGVDAKGKLDLSGRVSALRGGKSGPAIVPGKTEVSALLERVASDEMPPKTPLTGAEKEALRTWIADGARWGTDPIDSFRTTTSRRAGRDWWAFQPVVRPSVPAPKRKGWARTPIDSFVLQRLEAEGLSTAPETDRRTLIRRLAFDLTGLPPGPEEVDVYLADRSADAYERLVDRYLASPQYGVRWARWWLDLARYGESDGFEFDEFRPAAWRYRDRVVDDFNRDLPYDEFARLQLAGDGLRPGEPGAIEATGFLVAGAYDTVGQNQLSETMKAVVRADEIEDLVGTVCQTFLGLTVNCARCHDHKFDPIRQEEYYRIASALSGVRRGERDLSPIDAETVELKKKIETIADQVEAIEASARSQIVAARKSAASTPPEPIAAWNFDRSPRETRSSRELVLRGGASMTPDGLTLDGKTGYATASMPRDLKAKTIEAWVKLDGLAQRGGGVIGIQTPDGLVFDSIVFGEQEPGRWMAGSESFRRTSSAGGEAEVDTEKRPVHVAITYADDGAMRLYRNGQPYGAPYKSTGPVVFAASKAEVVFGMRHAPAGGNHMLAGTIVRASIYDRALDPAEVATSGRSFGDHVTPAELNAFLPADARERRSRLIAEIAALRTAIAARTHKAYAVIPREAGATRVQLRGNPGQLGSEVTAGGVAAVASLSADFGLPPDAPEAERRRRLAAWVTDARNPLFARVVVNRLWQAHFGTGLVETASDLGFNGGTPSHPELLDWLASEMAAQGWSLKAMHRLIVTSAVYRQSSRLDASAAARDAGDRLLWRKAPIRLEAEMVRDAMLFVSGRLDASLGGPSFRDHRLEKAAGTAAILYVPADPASPGLDRRTLYRAWARGGRSTLLDAFDCPDPSTTAPRRAVTTTPLQALSLMNNALTFHLSDALAARLVREAGPDPSRQTELAYRLAFGRLPEPAERENAVRTVVRFGPTVLSRAIFNSNEFLYLD
jgi:hypothetical protein